MNNSFQVTRLENASNLTIVTIVAGESGSLAVNKMMAWIATGFRDANKDTTWQLRNSDAMGERLKPRSDELCLASILWKHST